MDDERDEMSEFGTEPEPDFNPAKKPKKGVPHDDDLFDDAVNDGEETPEETEEPGEEPEEESLDKLIDEELAVDDDEDKKDLW